MSNSSLQAGWRGLVRLLLLGGLLAAAPDAGALAKPYVETTPKSGFHLFLRPKQKTPTTQ